MEELEVIVQRMIDANEPEDNIAKVIKEYNSKKENDSQTMSAAAESKTAALDTGSPSVPTFSELLEQAKDASKKYDNTRHEWMLDKNNKGEVVDYSFFNKSEKDAVMALSLAYDNFKFEEAGNLFDGEKYFNMVKVTAPNGKKSEAIEFRVYDAADPKDAARRRKESFEQLTSFINENSGDKERQDQDAKTQKDIDEYANYARTVESGIDKEAIIEEYSGDIFAPKTTVQYVPTSKIGGRVQKLEKVEQPYIKELQLAAKELGPNAPKFEIEARAREILINNAIASQRDRVSEELIEDSKEYKLLLEKGAKQFAEKYGAKIELNNSLLNDFENGDDIKKLREIDGKLSNTKYQFEIQEGEQTLTLEDGRVIPASILDEYNKANRSLNAKISHINSLQDEINSNIDIIPSTNQQLDLLKRNYDGIQKFFVTTGVGTAQLLDGASYGLKAFTGANSLEDDKKFIERQNRYQEIRQEFEKDVQFDDAFSSVENFFTFTAQELANQLPIFAALTTPVGFGIIGASGFGEQYSKMTSEQLDPFVRADYSDMEKKLASLGYAGAEVIFGALPTARLVRGATKSLTTTAARNELYKNQFKEFFKTKKLEGIVGAGNESLGEGLTIVTQNIINGVDPFENVDHAMFSGALFGTGFASVPLIKGAIVQKFSDFDTYQSVMDKKKQQKELHALNNRIEDQLQRGIVSIGTRDDIERNEKLINELEEDIISEINEIETKITKTYNGVAREFVEAVSMQQDLRVEYDRIKNSDLEADAKEQSLKLIELQFNSLQSGINKFKKSKTFDNAWALYSGKRKNKDEVKRIKEQAEEELKATGKQYSDTQIEDKARLIYNTEQIKKDISKSKSKYNKLNKSLKDFETKEQAIEYINEVYDNRIKAEPNREAELNNNRNSDIQAIQEGSHGFNIQTVDGRRSVVVIDSMAADDRLETRTHELKHQLFEQVLDVNPEVYSDLAEQILTWTDKYAKDSFERINAFADRQSGQDVFNKEVIAVFFEEVAANRINLNKASRFAGVLGYLTGKGARDVGLDIDLAGEEDAVKFLTGIAQKVKQGEIRVKTEVKDIKTNLKNKFKNLPTSAQDNSTINSKSKTQSGVFQNSNEALIETLKLAGIDNADLFTLDAEGLKELKQNRPEVFDKMIKDWNRLGDTKLWVGSSIGPVWRSFVEVNYLSKRDKATNYDLLKEDILDVATAGIDPGDNGIPYIVRSWLDENMVNSGNIRSLNSHIMGLINTRLMAKDGIIDRKFPRLGMKTVALDAPSEVTGSAIDLEGGETVETTLAKEKARKEQAKKAVEYSGRKAIGINDNFASKIEGIVEEILTSNELGSVANFEFTQKFKKQIETAVYKEIKSLMGKGVKGRETFLKDKRLDIMRIINTAELVQMEKREPVKILAKLVSSNQGPEVIKKAINDGLVQPFEVKDLNAGNNIYQKIKNPSEEAFVKFFSVRGRENALAKALAFNIGMDAIFPVVNKNDKIKEALGGEAAIKDLKARINRDQDVTNFSKNIANLELFGKNYLANGLDKLVKELKVADNFKEAFNKVYPKNAYAFEGKRIPIIKELQAIVGNYEDFDPISKASGIKNEKTLLEYIRQEVQERDEVSVSDIRNIFGLEKGSVSFSSKDQLISARKALLELCLVLGKTKSKRFLQPSVAGPAKIGSTEYIAKGVDILEIGLSQRKLNSILAKPEEKRTAKDKKKIAKYEKTIAEGLEITGTRYGLVDSSNDFENNFLSDERLKEDNLDILKPNAQNVSQYNKNKLNQDYKDLEARAKVEKDALVEIADALIKLIESNTISKNDAGMIMMSLANSGMNTPIARAATPRYFPATDVKGPFRWEHMIPRKVVANYMSGYINGKVKKDNFKKLLNNFHIAVIPQSTDNGLKVAGLESMMHATWSLENIYDIPRYINESTLGFWDVPLFDLKEGQVVPETLKWAEANAIITDNVVELKKYKVLSDAMSNARTLYSKNVGMSTFDFDETLIIDGENFIIAKKEGEEIKISSGDWPIKGPALAQEGWDFDFSDFVNVRGGVDGPLLQKMRNQIKKYGVDNVFVLTARPAEAATAIHEWLKTKGINIPFENITGLGDSRGDAKAEWMLEKYAEGYNDMYFVDDALPNVEAVQHVFNQLDVKGKSIQAKTNFSKRLSKDFNQMLQRTKGVGAEKVFSRVAAQKRGKNVGKYRFFVPPSADDFAGLLYYFYGKGKQGDADMQFMKKALLDPFARADREMSIARMAILDDYKELRKQFPEVKKKLGKLINKDSGFTFDNAIRVYLFNKAGYDIPGLSKRDVQFLDNVVKTDQDLKSFADLLGLVSKRKEGYIEPTDNWSVENIASDMQNIVDKIGRKQFLAEFIENKDIIFSPENMNKIEAIYGSQFRQALEDVLFRMENGTNRSANKSYGQAWTNWVNGSVGAIMFFNSRSAVLQTLSTVNFINFQDNNIFAAGKALANQKQYWSDFSTLFNSDFLRARRAGLQINVNEAELASAVAGAQNKAKAALRYLLKIGFTPTQIADSFAIASGGSTFYRNRINTYLKQGMAQKTAEEKAFLDFQEIAQETQQSSRPDRISQQQASPLGRLILAFANTPLQYNRLIKKAYLDLANRRGDWRSNVSRILYYGAIQNVIFSAMQSAIFALSFDDEEDDELDRRTIRIVNGMTDTILRGSGVTGAAIATIKNVIMEFAEQSKRESRADYGQVVVEALQVSPPMGSKARKLYSALNTYKFDREIMASMNTFDYNNPIWDAIGNVTSAATNLPLDRGFRKIDNIREALNQDNSAMQRAFLFLGWSSFDLQVGERVVMNKGKKNEYVKYLDTKRQAQQEAEDKLKKEKKQTRKSKQCTARSRNTGRRCQNTTTNKSGRCYVHNN